MEEKMELIVIKVSPSLKQRLETAAEIEGMTVSGFIQSMLTMVLEEEADFTHLSSMKLQRIILFGIISQMSNSITAQAMLVHMLAAQSALIGQGGPVEKYLKIGKGLERDMARADKMLKIITEGKWDELYSYMERMRKMSIYKSLSYALE